MGRTERLGIPGSRYAPDAGETRFGHGARPGVTAFDRWMLRAVMRALRDPDLLLALWDGEEIGPRDSRPAVARIRFLDRGALLRLLARPKLGAGDMYSAGRVEVDGDLVAVIEAINRTFDASTESDGVWRLPGRLRVNSPRRARHNIHHHYDVGNDFYRLWLDTESLQYTCAYFPRAEMTLEQAQQAKLHHVCRKLRLRRGERVVEAGCGWGGLALFMARHYGVRVRAYNISREQIAYARERAVREGLEDRVEYVEDDYRNIDGSYDVFVSVGMLEHVGRAHYRALGRVIDRCLTERGRGLLHSIGRNRAYAVNPWIRKRIFPGSYVPTLAEMAGILEPAAFSVTDVENLRLHYAQTLRHWLERFEAQRGEVRSMFDERFVRAWRLYLCGSIAAFTTGWLQLFQLVFVRPDVNDLAPSRAHLYEETT